MELFIDYVVYAAAILLVGAVLLFVKSVVFNRRPQKTGLFFALTAVPLYLIYYSDRWPWGNLGMRELVRFLDNPVQGVEYDFESDVAPAAIVAAILLVHMTVFQRLSVRERLQRVHNPIANFFAGSVAATMVGGTLVSAFGWGWKGALIIAAVFTLIYLGALALVAALLELVVAVVKLFAVWVKRKIFTLATMISRVSSWVSSLSGRLGLNSLADKIRADTEAQESLFVEEQEDQDRRLYEAYVRDRARKRKGGGKAAAEVMPSVPAQAVPAPAAPVEPAPPAAAPPAAAPVAPEA